MQQPIWQLLLLLSVVLPGCVSLAPHPQDPGTAAQAIEGVPVRKWADNSCAAGALSEVLNALGDPVTEHQLSSSLTRARRGGVTTVDLLLAARSRGFDAQLVRGNAEIVRWELGQNRPVILMIRVMNAPGHDDDLFHYIVLSGLDAERGLVSLNYGDGKRRWVPLDELKGTWAAAAYATFLIGPKIKRDATEDDLRRAAVLEAEGRSAQAITLYRQYLSSHPESALAWTNLGNALAGTGEQEQAEVAYRNALFLEKDNRDALNNLAWLLLHQSRLDEAEVLARRAVAQDLPDRAVAVDTLEKILSAKRSAASTPLSKPQSSLEYDLPRSARPYWTSYAWLTLATIYDVESTLYLLQRCEECKETNPLVRTFVDRGRAATYAYSVAVNGIVMYFARRMFDRGDPRWDYFPFALSIVHAIAGSWNVIYASNPPE